MVSMGRISDRRLSRSRSSVGLPRIPRSSTAEGGTAYISAVGYIKRSGRCR